MADRIVELLKEVSGSKEFAHVNLSEEKARELVYEIYGGEEAYSLHYPLLYRQITQTDACGGTFSAEKMAQDYLKEDIGIFADGVAMDIYGLQEDGSFIIQEISSFKDIQEMIEQGIVVADAAGNVTEWVKKGVSCATTLKMELRSEKMLAGQVYDIFCYSIEMKENEKTQMEICTSYRFQVASSVCTALNTELEFPKHSGSGKDDTVYICYNRYPSEVEKFDRIYDSALTNSHQTLYLDVYGNIQLKPEYTYSSVNPVQFYMRLSTDTGMAYYKNKVEIGSCFTAEGSTIRYVFPKEWEDYVPTDRLSSEDRAELTISFVLSNLQKEEGKIVEDHFLFSHEIPKDMGGDRCYTPLLSMVWGCVDADSMVRMADGTEKPMKEFQIGDRVITAKGKLSAVVNIWTGNQEEKGVRIETKCGKALNCTKTHPILTKRGMVRAGSLSYADILFGESGEEYRIRYLYPVFMNQIMNLELDGGEHSFLCEGIAVGDNHMQNTRLGAEAESGRPEIMAEIVKRLEKINK